MLDDARFSGRFAEFRGELQDAGRSPDTIRRYGVAVREFDLAATTVSANPDRHVWDREAIGEYARSLADRELAPSTISTRLTLVGAFARWLEEHDPSVVDPAVSQILGAARRGIARDAAPGAGPMESGRLLYLLADALPVFAVDGGGGDGGGQETGGGGQRAEPDSTSGAESHEDAFPDGEPVARHLQALSPDRGVPGRTINVVARIARDAEGGAATALLKPTIVPPGGLDMHLLISAPKFDTLSDQFVAVHVPQQANSEWITFALRAREEGIHEVEIHALTGGTHLGSVLVKIAIAREAGDATMVTTTDVMVEHEPVAGEVTLIVTYEPTGSPPVFRYQLFHQGSGNPPVLTTAGLTANPTLAIERLIGQLDKLARNATTMSVAVREELIKQHGIKLWTDFVPEPLQEAIWAVADGMQRLTIVSGQDPVPWEIIHPSTPGKPEKGFLVEWADLVRWPSGPRVRRAPATLPFDAVRFVLPSDAPAQAAAEIEGLRVIDPRLAGGQRVATAERFIETIREADWDLLHLACHNTFSAGVSALRIGDQDIETVFLAQAEARGTLAAHQPLVFMNACRSAGQAPVYTTIDGWAQGFIRAGAGAFVGTLWAVRDASARSFAETFYGQLVQGSAFGAAMSHARRATRDVTGDPTWLAYAAYGNPSAVLKEAHP